MTLDIYRAVNYDLDRNRIVRYILFVDGKYLMHYVTNSYKKKIERDAIELLRRKVLTYPCINDYYKTRVQYMPQGELVHEESDSELLKKLQIKMRVNELEKDFEKEE